MRFNTVACLVIVVAVIASAVVSFLEGTLTNKRVAMGFVNHGGMWGDLVIMSLVSGLVVPYLSPSHSVLLFSFGLAIVITVVAHDQWAKGAATTSKTDHIFPKHDTGIWYMDISFSGWMHVVLMTLLLATVFIYVVSPIPPNLVLTVSVLLTAHVFVGTVLPRWHSTGVLWTRKNFGLPMLVAGLVWSVALWKIRSHANALPVI